MYAIFAPPKCLKKVNLFSLMVTFTHPYCIPVNTIIEGRKVITHIVIGQNDIWDDLNG